MSYFEFMISTFWLRRTLAQIHQYIRRDICMSAAATGCRISLCSLTEAQIFWRH